MNNNFKLKFIMICALMLSGQLINAQSQSQLKVFLQPQSYRGSSIQYGNNASAGHYVKADDANIYYEVYGEGKPIVMLHGGGLGCTYEMGQLIDSLSTTNKVIAISTRGHGKSEIGTVPVNYPQKGNDVFAVMQDCIPGEKAVVIGFSDGGYSGYKLASMHPEVVEKLITIGAGEDIPMTRKFITPSVEAIKAIDPQFIETQMALMPQPERLQAYWTEYFDFYNNLTVSKELFGSIKCPVLLIAGELDPNAPLATVLAAYQMIPNSQLAIIANAGHGAFIDNFPAVWANIVPFIRDWR